LGVNIKRRKEMFKKWFSKKKEEKTPAESNQKPEWEVK